MAPEFAVDRGAHLGLEGLGGLLAPDAVVVHAEPALHGLDEGGAVAAVVVLPAGDEGGLLVGRPLVPDFAVDGGAERLLEPRRGGGAQIGRAHV